MIFFYNSIYFSKLIWLQKKNFTQIFIYFSKPLKLLYSLIIYEIVNFSFFALYSLLLLSFFLYLKSVPTCIYIVHVRDWSCTVHLHTMYMYMYLYNEIRLNSKYRNGPHPPHLSSTGVEDGVGVSGVSSLLQPSFHGCGLSCHQQLIGVGQVPRGRGVATDVCLNVAL